LVVSDLPENENTTLAERLARPVVEHLQNAETEAGQKEGIRRGKLGEGGDRGAANEPSGTKKIPGSAGIPACVLRSGGPFTDPRRQECLRSQGFSHESLISQ